MTSARTCTSLRFEWLHLGAVLGLLLTARCGSESSQPSGSSSAAAASAASTERPSSSSSSASGASSASSADGASASAATSASASAAPPSTAIADMQKDALARPEVYSGKQHRVSGLYVGSQKVNMGPLTADVYRVQMVDNILVADSKEEGASKIICEMNKWVPPEGLKVFDRVTIEGRSYMDPPARGRKLVIGNCVLTVDP